MIIKISQSVKSLYLVLVSCLKATVLHKCAFNTFPSELCVCFVNNLF